MDIDTLSTSEHRKAGPVSIDICDKTGKSILRQKPEIARNDAEVTFLITDNDMLQALKSGGCKINGKNVRFFNPYERDEEKWIVEWFQADLDLIRLSFLPCFSVMSLKDSKWNLP